MSTRKKMNSCQLAEGAHGATREAAGARGSRPSSARAALVLLSIALLASCGFQALHGEQYRQSLAVDLSAVAVAVAGSGTLSTTNTIPLPLRYSELLKAEIEDQVNPTTAVAQKQFQLNITYTETSMALFVKPDGTASRGDLILNSNYTLTRRADQAILAQGAIQRTSSYNSSDTADYASYVSIEDARKRGILELAQDYKLRLASLLPTLNDPNAKAIDPNAHPTEAAPTLQPVRNYETRSSGY